MTNTVTLGWRRLYDALGVTAQEGHPITATAPLQNGKHVSIYIGKTPPGGILTINEGGYLVPGRKIVLLKPQNDYKAECFLDISIHWNKQLDEEQNIKFINNDQSIHQELLKEADEQLSERERFIDAIAGILGLRLHRQLTLKPLIEHSFLSGGAEPVRSFVGPVWEQLCQISPPHDASAHLQNLLNRLSATPDGSIIKSGATLHWLLKAWREKDHIARFMYLFIPLESVIPRISNTNTQTKINDISEIVKSSNAHNKTELLAFLQNAKGRLNPSLTARFEELARRHGIPGWKIDVEAFNKFQKMRNDLLHDGNRKLTSHIDFEAHARTLEDLVERYISLELFGTPEVYQSIHRPNRESVII